MCGIAGIIDTNPGALLDQRTIHEMCQTIVHRGPDDEGIYVNDGVGLGMRRLSIIDLSGGHQPVHNEDGSVWIVFNGEIYNFPALRSELEGRGHRFYTHTDTEVIVHLWEDFGPECVQKLRGMFAFALYDERRRSFLLARDRLGIKPLHYSFVGGRLLFGSEIKAILAAAPELKEVNPEGVLQYFYFGYVPDPQTAFKRIHKLPPGHVLHLIGSQISVRQYWDLPRYGTYQSASEQEIVDELERRLAEAVRIRLIADVPLGALLSGGTDSSIVVALMARASDRPVKTFSIGFAREEFNEAHHARQVAQRFATDHHELIVEPNFSQTLDELTHTLEEPFGDSSMLPTYYVSRMARQQVTVALSGDGGDELFAGYDRYAVNLRRGVPDRVPSSVGRWYRKHIHPWVPHGIPGRHRAFNACLSRNERYLDHLAYLPALGRERFLFSDGFLDQAESLRNPLDLFGQYLETAPATDPLSRLLYLDTKTYLAGDILTKVDRMSMATSLEVRVPILDHVFLEWVTALPADWKLRGGTQKYILRKLAERVGVPHSVLARPKQGFSMPLVHWMRFEFKDHLKSVLLDPQTLQRGYFRPSAVRQLLNEHLRGWRRHTGRLWQLLIFELWHRNFLGSSGGSQLSSIPVTALSEVQPVQKARGEALNTSAARKPPYEPEGA